MVEVQGAMVECNNEFSCSTIILKTMEKNHQKRLQLSVYCWLVAAKTYSSVKMYGLEILEQLNIPHSAPVVVETNVLAM